MEIRYKLYPYPVLAYYSDDYKDGSFDTTIDLQKDGYSKRRPISNTHDCGY